MCVLSMDYHSSELHELATGYCIVPGVQQGFVDPMMEPLLCTDSSQSSPMIDLAPAHNASAAELHYLSVFEQLDMLEQQNLELQESAASLMHSSSSGAAPAENLDPVQILEQSRSCGFDEILVHHEFRAAPPLVESPLPVAKSSSSTASSCSSELFGTSESGATSVPQQQKRFEEQNAWKGHLEQQDHWSCDPNSFYTAQQQKGMFLNSSASSLPQQHNNGLHATMRETLYRMAIWKPVNLDCVGSKPKRRNVRISSDPQTVAARHRRERISTKIRILQRLVPGGTKMDTASMLDEAIHYVKYLKSQVQAMELLEQSSGSPTESLLMRGSSNATSAGSGSAAATPTPAQAPPSGMCHLYNTIFWPQQFSMDSSTSTTPGGLVVQPVNISGY